MSAPDPSAAAVPSPRRELAHRVIPYVIAGVLISAAVASVFIGSRDIGVGAVLEALRVPRTPAELWRLVTDADTLKEYPHHVIVVFEERIPRTLLGVIAGLALGAAGALAQGCTRNPLADPGLLGVTAGASFAVVIAIFLLNISSIPGYALCGLIGALLASIAVFASATLGSRTADPLTLILAGVAVSAFLSALTTGIALRDAQTFQDMRMWSVGSLAARPIDVVLGVGPLIAIGLLLAAISAAGLNLLNLGDDVASGLGAAPGRVRLIGMAGMAILAGSATAGAGPIAFVGLMAPHIARWLTGPDYRRVVPAAAMVGAVLLLISDTVGRVVLRPFAEIPVGIVVALLGAPVFILLARSRRTVRL